MYFNSIDFIRQVIQVDTFLTSSELKTDIAMNGKFVVLPILGRWKCKMEFSKYIYFFGAELRTHTPRLYLHDYTSSEHFPPSAIHKKTWLICKL
jgi:hypothetical protein